MALLNYGSSQYGAVAGGRRRRFPYREMIYAAQPQVYAAKAREEDIDFRQRQLASQTAYQEDVLAHQEADLEFREDVAEEQARLRREQLAESKKQATTGAIISGTQTVGIGGYLGYKEGLFKGGTGAGLKTAAPYAGAGVAGYYGGGVLANQPQARATLGTAATGGHGTEPQKAMMTGGVGGAAAGFAVGGPPGAVIGGVSGAYKAWKEAGGKGGFGGFMKESTYGPFTRKGFVRESIRDPIGTIGETIISPSNLCIIITAATSPYSYEVNLARVFRDEFLGPITLRGYYMIADKVVPLMRKSALFKKIVKKHLIDHLIKYGEWVFGMSKRQPHKSTTITKNFLKLCRFFGSFKSFYIRSNGEIL